MMSGSHSEKRITKAVSLAILNILFICLLSCASVPKEAVELSYLVGQDIQELNVGYRRTVVAYFEQMRQTGLGIIEKIWTPVYLKDNIRNSELFEHLKDTSIKESERYGDLEYWLRGAIKDIDNKRKEFLDSLKQKESTLLAAIDDAFSRLIRANATVTSHLHSVVKLKEQQDDILKSAGLKGIRDNINDGLAEASKFTSELTKDVEAAAKKLEGAKKN